MKPMKLKNYRIVLVEKLQLLVITFLILTVNSTVIAQQVNRNMVVLEIATATWCSGCPGAAMGAEDLIENGKNVAVIEYHDDDDFGNSYGISRMGFYDPWIGYPTAFFDGVLTHMGGNHTTSLYPTYLPLYEQRIVKPSSFTIDMEGSNSKLSEYEINITVTKVATINSTSLVLHFALTESKIPYFWEGMDTLNFVERLMRPNQYGTVLDFSSNNVNEITLNFTMDPSWVDEHCEVIAFIQDTVSKEILQGTKAELIDLVTSNVIENSNPLNFKVYPNPVSNIAYASFYLNNTVKTKYEIYNSMGKIVYRGINKNFTAGKHVLEINTSHFKNGIYYIKFYCGEISYQSKIIVAK